MTLDDKMNKMVFDLLNQAKVVSDGIFIFVPQLANEYGLDEKYVEEKLVELHDNEIIRLSSEGNYKRVRLLLKGAELLESESEPPRGIGFHG